MSKPGARRILTDDFAVEVDGETYHPHEGEWVDLIGSPTVGEMRAYAALAQFGVQLQAARGDADEDIQAMSIMDRYFGVVCDGLARRIVDWSWTDDLGRELPSPGGNPAVFEQLSQAELNYLVGITGGETRAQRGNASRPSPTTSSATRSPGTAGPRSIKAHSPSRAS